jgi:hypothetical protein
MVGLECRRTLPDTKHEVSEPIEDRERACRF